MGTYKIVYIYTDYSETYHGKRVKSYDIYEEDNAQDAVDSCREDFYIQDELEIIDVLKWSPFGYWLPVLPNGWT